MSEIIAKYRKENPDNIIVVDVDHNNSDYAQVKISDENEITLATSLYKIDGGFEEQRKAIEFAIMIAPAAKQEEDETEWISAKLHKPGDSRIFLGIEKDANIRELVLCYFKDGKWHKQGGEKADIVYYMYIPETWRTQ